MTVFYFLVLKRYKIYRNPLLQTLPLHVCLIVLASSLNCWGDTLLDFFSCQESWDSRIKVFLLYKYKFCICPFSYSSQVGVSKWFHFYIIMNGVFQIKVCDYEWFHHFYAVWLGWLKWRLGPRCEIKVRLKAVTPATVIIFLLHFCHRLILPSILKLLEMTFSL